MQITVDGYEVTIDGLALADQGLADLLGSQPEERWPELLERALSVGARGLMTMGLGLDLAEIDARVRRSVAAVTSEAEQHVSDAITSARDALAQQLDPELRSSAVARTLAEFTSWRDDFLRTLDPTIVDSHTSRLVASLTELVGPDGTLEARLHALLDPDADEGGFAALSTTIDNRFNELRDLMMHKQGAEAAATMTTQKGFDFEDVIDDALRTIVGRSRGSFVERTSLERGSGDAKVGDFVVTLGSGERVVIEAKNTTAPISLGGRGGILAELDRAAANRQAVYAICVSANPVFTKEVGTFGIFGDRLCVVDDGDGTMLAAALAWAEGSIALAGSQREGVDVRAIEDRLHSLRGLASQVSNARRSLTQIATSVNSLKGVLDELRSDLLSHVDDISREVGRDQGTEAETPQPVVELHSA